MDHMQYGLTAIDFTTGESAAGRTGFNRRNFLVTALASGFALAASPVMAQAIKTNTRGLIAGEVSIPVAGGKIPGYRAMPAKGSNFPTIVVVQEIFGLHEHIQDICRRLAKLGYYAISAELFSREGDASKMPDIQTIVQKIISILPDAQVMSDIDATVAFAKASRHANTDRLGMVGFCWGGRTTWLYSAHNPKVKAAVSYYGLLEGMKGDNKPSDPLDIAATIKVPVLGLYAALDSYIKQEAVSKMEKGLQQSGSGSQIVVFPEVDHGFNADYRPTYNAVTAGYAWNLTLDWFKKHGV